MTRLLVIEDEAPLLEIILTMLRYTGFDVVGALDGAAGVGLAHTYQPDLVISDIRMPELDGYGVLQALRSDPVTAALPFIFLTAKAEHDDIRHGMGLGADDYLTKPFTNEELLEAIETRLSRQTPYHALQQRLDEVSKAEQFKTDLIRIAAHDLRNPLTSVKLALNVLKRKYSVGSLDEHLDEYNQISTATAQMEAITSDILSLERASTTTQGAVLQPVDLDGLVRSAYRVAYPQAQAKHQRFEFEMTSSTMMVLADPVQLRGAIQNLLSNAIKYTPEGGAITIHLERREKTVQLTVEDNGYGVPDDQMGYLFQPFYRAQTPETEAIDGFGLGLNLVKNIIERHSGKMIAQSVYGHGSVFGFFLPIYNLAPEVTQFPAYPAQTSRPGLVRRLIGHITSF